MAAKIFHSSALGQAWSCSQAFTLRTETPTLAATSGWERLAAIRFKRRWSPTVLALTGISFRGLYLSLEWSNLVVTVRCVIPNS